MPSEALPPENAAPEMPSEALPPENAAPPNL